MKRRWTPGLALPALLLAMPASVHAAAAVCEEPSDEPGLVLAFDLGTGSSPGSDGSSLDRRQHDLDLRLASRGGGLIYGLGHRYSVFDITPERQETNGHLHTVFLPFHWLPGDGQRNRRVSVAPAVSASSNVMQELDQYAGDAFQVLAAIVWGRSLSDSVDLDLGICGDHRFGDYRAYPTASIDWRPHPDWEISPGYPVSQVQYRLTGSMGSTLRFGPDGNEWFVANRELDSHAILVNESWALELEFDWRVASNIVATFAAGRQYDNKLEVASESGAREKLEFEAFNRVGVELAWRF